MFLGFGKYTGSFCENFATGCCLQWHNTQFSNTSMFNFSLMYKSLLQFPGRCSGWGCEISSHCLVVAQSRWMWLGQRSQRVCEVEVEWRCWLEWWWTTGAIQQVYWPFGVSEEGWLGTRTCLQWIKMYFGRCYSRPAVRSIRYTGQMYSDNNFRLIFF